MSTSEMTPKQQAMIATWEQHAGAEFFLKDADAAVATMNDNPYILAVATGDHLVGRERVRSYYRDEFLSKIPPDLEFVPVSRMVGDGKIFEELVIRFTHTIEMPWLAPGVPPTNKRAEVLLGVLVVFDGDKIAFEHLYWDHATLLSQLGVIDNPAAAGGTRTVPAVLAHAKTAP